MTEPILKMHWERFKAHLELDVATAATLLFPYETSPIENLTLLSEGCANTNYKVTFKNNTPPVVIRIYARGKSALARELAIQQFVSDNIPVAKHLYTNFECKDFSYPYSIMEWIDGRLMREVILTKDEQATSECAFEAGQYLNQLRQMKFSQGGFFQEGLKIRPFNEEEKYLPYVLNLLEDSIVAESLGASLLCTISDLVTQYATLLPNEAEANLTHADYDPANMLVKKIHDKWKIVAILDWEFAYAGTYLLDIGMMLRYSHKLPDCYEHNFIAGIQTDGFHLPKEWKKQAKLMDLLCLLQLSHYNPLKERPNTNRDVVSLIANMAENWRFF